VNRSTKYCENEPNNDYESHSGADWPERNPSRYDTNEHRYYEERFLTCVNPRLAHPPITVYLQYV
jgi:hypothetical protein